MKPPPSVTQRNKQPWHPDEDDEEFTANEDEGQACSLYLIAPCPLNSLDLTFSCFLLSSTWTGSCDSVPIDLGSFSLAAEDEEDTIAAEEQLEGDVDHAMELSELAREGDIHQTFHEHPLGAECEG